MNWLLAIIGAIFGAGLAETQNLFGALAGFTLVMALLAINRLRRESDAATREISVLKAKLAALSVARPLAAAESGEPAAATSAPAASEAGPREAMPEAGPRPVAQAVQSDVAAGVAAERAAPAPPAPATAPRATAPAPRAPSGPSWEERALAKLKHWFTEGNVPVKIGVLVLLFGVGAALKLAQDRGYFNLSVEMRLAVIAAVALAGLAWGWRERLVRPAFGLSLQGGALGVLLLTVFAAYRLYSLLPPGLAFALVVVLVAGAAALAVLQDAMALAVLGFLGGYLAPVLISTGSANHVALFSYYAVLNAAVFAISWRQSWRLLNLIGFVFTFGVGTAWGAERYRPESFPSVEPFLILFFAFYILIGLAYVLRQTEHRRPWVDGTLVFGTPLIAFPLQAAMLRHDRIGMALSALVVALVYAGLVAWLRNRRGERLLTEAYGALALGFATLAVPLAFSASTTASLWALEGAGVAWLGIRQKRNFPWLAGLGLQLLAAGAYLVSMGRNGMQAEPMLLLNAQWLGAALLSFSGFALALIHDRHRPVPGLPALLFAWGVLWWLVGAGGQMDQATASGFGEWRFLTVYLAVSALLAALLRQRLAWPRLQWIVALTGVAGLALVLAADGEYGSPFAVPTLACWAVYALAQLHGLWRERDERSNASLVAHLSWLWTVAMALSLQMKDFSDVQQLAQGWRFLALLAPLAMMTLALWRRTVVFAWPRALPFQDQYRQGWFAPALLLLSGAFLIGLFLEGSASPLPYVPLLNPLELGLLGIAALVLARSAGEGAWQSLHRAWPIPAFAFLTLATLRAVHHLHGEAWGGQILDSGFSQASLTVVWSLAGVTAWILGSRRRNRAVWTGGAVLMGIVLLKLLFVDRSYMGNVPGIVSFIAVGLLLVVVGYLAPSPPREPAMGEPA
jgi:uncharacterized membrane protein